MTQEGKPREGKSSYSYTDVSGTYGLNREGKLLKNRLVTRSQLTESKSGSVVEKSITVSRLGTIKDKKDRLLILRPEASEFTVWLEGKKYSSQMQLNPRNKSMSVKLDGPEPKWQGTSDVPFPRGKNFCFFSQIPDCLYHNQFLSRGVKNPKQELPFHVVWDSYPFMQEQFSGLSKKLFSAATVKFDGEVKKIRRFVVELEGQVIVYQFTGNYDLVRMAWIAQGITVVPPGEEISNEDE